MKLNICNFTWTLTLLHFHLTCGSVLQKQQHNSNNSSSSSLVIRRLETYPPKGCLSKCNKRPRNLVCGNDGLAYRNQCKMNCFDIQKDYNGRCVSKLPPPSPLPPPSTRTKKASPRCIKKCRGRPGNVVCGKDGVSYWNQCEMNCFDAKKDSNGPCEEPRETTPAHPSSLPPPPTAKPSRKCIKRCNERKKNRVCGMDGVTYRNQCEMNCFKADKNYNGRCIREPLSSRPPSRPPTFLPPNSTSNITSVAPSMSTAPSTSTLSITPTSPPTPLICECIEPKQSNFTLTLLNVGEEVSEKVANALGKAKARWESIIVNDLVDAPANLTKDWFLGIFPGVSYNGMIDDVLIGFNISSIDGPGKTLGFAKPIFQRLFNGRPHGALSGQMVFDKDDVDSVNMTETDLEIIITHEIGHVLGLGVIGDCENDCKFTNSTSRKNIPYQCYTSGKGKNIAQAAYSELVPGGVLLLENDGGWGTKCSHWEEEIFDTDESSEMMTGFFERGKGQPLSCATVAALEDMGAYQVDYCGADVWPYTGTIKVAGESGNDIGGGRKNKKGFEVLIPTTTFTPDGRSYDFPGADTNSRPGGPEDFPSFNEDLYR